MSEVEKESRTEKVQVHVPGIGYIEVDAPVDPDGHREKRPPAQGVGTRASARAARTERGRGSAIKRTTRGGGRARRG